MGEGSKGVEVNHWSSWSERPDCCPDDDHVVLMECDRITPLDELWWEASFRVWCARCWWKRSSVKRVEALPEMTLVDREERRQRWVAWLEEHAGPLRERLLPDGAVPVEALRVAGQV